MPNIGLGDDQDPKLLSVKISIRRRRGALRDAVDRARQVGRQRFSSQSWRIVDQFGGTIAPAAHYDPGGKLLRDAPASSEKAANNGHS
jgi:hypothetical protein